VQSLRCRPASIYPTPMMISRTVVTIRHHLQLESVLAGHTNEDATTDTQPDAEVPNSCRTVYPGVHRTTLITARAGAPHDHRDSVYPGVHRSTVITAMAVAPRDHQGLLHRGRHTEPQ
jgi:hypothetical protein